MNLLPENNFYKRILKLALPAIAGLSTQMVVSLVDSAMVGRLEDAKYALAAMGIGVLATWALVSFFSSLATGTHVIVARKFGAKDYKGCGVALDSSLLISFSVGVVVALAGIFAADEIADFFASDPLVAVYAGDYIFYRFLGIPFFLISVSYRGFFFGISKPKIFMFSGIMTNFLNIIFNYILIYGSFGFPKMGLAGAGLGSTLATVTDFSLYLVVTLLPSYRKFETYRFFRVDKKLMKKIYEISLPVSFQNVFILIGFLAFIAITGIIGTQEQAATQAVISIMFMSFLPCFGFGIAAQTLVGNNIGSGKFKLAKIYGFETAKIASYYTVFLGILFLSIPDIVLLIITNDQSIINTAVPVLRIAGFAQIFYATGVVLANGLQAAGKTLYVMTAEVVANLLLFVPLAYFLGIYLELGLSWAWGALPFYIILYSLIIFLKFKRDRWHKEMAVID